MRVLRAPDRPVPDTSAERQQASTVMKDPAAFLRPPLGILLVGVSRSIGIFDPVKRAGVVIPVVRNCPGCRNGQLKGTYRPYSVLQSAGQKARPKVSCGWFCEGLCLGHIGEVRSPILAHRFQLFCRLGHANFNSFSARGANPWNAPLASISCSGRSPSSTAPCVPAQQGPCTATSGSPA